jgi:alkylation response protein AidB-like acyl-CoA dehydrogenase
MSTTTNAALREIRELARQVAADQLRPHVERWDRDRTLDAAALAQLAELGFFGMLVPEEHGGMGFDVPTYAAALEELAWGEASVALTVAHASCVAQMILRHGDDAQRRRWLEPLAGGSVRACFAASEEHAGSDATAIEARARRDGEEWILTGEKRWVTNGAAADVALVLARTADIPPDAGRRSQPRGIGAFLVPTSAAGYRVGERVTTMGFRPVDIVTVHLDDVRVPADALLGDPVQGFLYTVALLDLNRMGVAAIALGIAQAALDHATAYAAEREQFGRKLHKFQGLQFKLADMAIRTEAARALLGIATASPSARTCSMAKVFASEAAMWVTTQAVQIFGGYGYMRDYPVEKLMRDAKATEILEGTNEIQRVLIARELYRG